MVSTLTRSLFWCTGVSDSGLSPNQTYRYRHRIIVRPDINRFNRFLPVSEPGLPPARYRLSIGHCTHESGERAGRMGWVWYPCFSQLGLMSQLPAGFPAGSGLWYGYPVRIPLCTQSEPV
jgi:hypothetical protein